MGSAQPNRSTNAPEYLGALLDDEQRLVLVEVDPMKPWEAVRRMRAFMRRTRKSRAHAAAVDVFAPGADLRHEATVISFPRR